MDVLTSIPVDALSSPGGLALSLSALVTSVAYALRSLGGANARSLDAITKSIETLERELGETKTKLGETEGKHKDCEEKHSKLEAQLAAQRREIDGLRQSIASTVPTRCEDCGARIVAKETPAVRAKGDHR